MRLGIVLLGSLILVFIVGLIIALIAAIVTYSINKSKRKSFLAFCLPFIFIFTLFFSALIGSIIVSEVKNVDIGMGDSWYAPINDSYQIGMIDVPDAGYIQCNQGVLVNDIAELQEYPDNTIKGKTTSGQFFVLNLNNREVNYYSSEQELIKNTGTNGFAFIKVADFEAQKYKQAAGTGILIAGILSLIISILVSYLFSKIFLFTMNKFVRWRRRLT
jgi:predicted PurR-regulated permease PerM